MATDKSTTSEQAAEVAHNVIDSAARKAENVEKKVRETAAETRVKAEHQTKQMTDTVVDYVNEKPIAALGIAFVAGVLASAILRK